MTVRHSLKWVKNIYGGGALYQSYPEGASEAFRTGAPLVYDESENGVVEVARTSGVPDNQDLLGLAQTTGVNDSNNLFIDVLIPRPGDIFEGVPATAVGTVVAPTQDMIGNRVGLIKLNNSDAGGSGNEYALHSDGTNWAKVINVHPQDVERRGGVASLAVGDRLLFQFLNTILESDGSRA